MNSKDYFLMPKINFIDGNSTIYLDSAATSLKLQSSLLSSQKYYQNFNANVHRSGHKLALEATKEVEDSRVNISNYLNCDSNEIIFTSGATDSINLVALTYCNDWNNNDVIFISESEHHSNIFPWYGLHKRNDVKLEIIPVDEQGYFDLNYFIEKVEQYKIGRKILAINHISNVTGVENNIKKICKVSREYDVITMVDGAQSISKKRIDLSKIKCDFFVFSGHKVYSPTGTGILFSRNGVMNDKTPMISGGSTVNSFSFDEIKYLEQPYKFEAGTMDIAGIIGLGDTFYTLNDYDIITDKYIEVENLLHKRLSVIPNINLGVKNKNRNGIISFTIDNINSIDIEKYLDMKDICVRTGWLCAEPYCRKIFNNEIPLRVSLGVYNTEEEVNELITALNEVIHIYDR